MKVFIVAHKYGIHDVTAKNETQAKKVFLDWFCGIKEEEIISIN